jgi:hypothetical protein
MVDDNPSVAVSIFLSIIMSDDEFAVVEAAILGLGLGENWLLFNGFITLNWTYKVVLDTPLLNNNNAKLCDTPELDRSRNKECERDCKTS